MDSLSGESVPEFADVPAVNPVVASMRPEFDSAVPTAPRSSQRCGHWECGETSPISSTGFSSFSSALVGVSRAPAVGLVWTCPGRCRRGIGGLVDLVLGGLGHWRLYILSIRCLAIFLAIRAPLGCPAQKMNSKRGEFLEFFRVRDSGRKRVPNTPLS